MACGESGRCMAYGVYRCTPRFLGVWEPLDHTHPHTLTPYAPKTSADTQFMFRGVDLETLYDMSHEEFSQKVFAAVCVIFSSAYVCPPPPARGKTAGVRPPTRLTTTPLDLRSTPASADA